jgi:hypothetical protein
MSDLQLAYLLALVAGLVLVIAVSRYLAMEMEMKPTLVEQMRKVMAAPVIRLRVKR